MGGSESFTTKLHEAIVKAGVKSNLMTADKNNPQAFIDQVLADNPDFTLSFNGLLPDEQGRFLCDMLNIPHVACLVDSPNTFVNLSHSPLTIITCVDKMACQFFTNLHCENVIFMPHAVDSDFPAPKPGQERPYDVVFLGACINHEEIREKWKKKYPPYLVETLELAAEIVTTSLEISFAEALVAAMNEKIWFPGVDVSTFDFVELLDELEYFVRGKDRVDLLKAIKDVKVDVFTYAEQKKDWEKLIGPGHDNIVLHDSVPFEKALEIMKESKIILSSAPMFKNGSHERIFAGLASEAIVVTNPSKYIMEEFDESEGVIIYDLKNPEKLNADIQKYLTNPALRAAAGKKGRAKVMQRHTWDVRAKDLLNHLDSILQALPK